MTTSSPSSPPAANEPPTKRRDLRTARLLATVFSAGLVGLGVWEAFTASYYGRSSKYGGAEVFLEGRAAVMAGLGEALIGLAPLALWANTPHRAALWMGSCLVAGVALMLAAR